MSSMLPGERFAQSEYPSAGKRGEVLHTADHLNHGSMMKSMQHASGHAEALLQLPYDSFLTMDHGDRHQIFTASTADQLHEQAASARAAAAHQDLQLQLAIGYSNDRPAVQLDHHGTQNSLQWSQTFPGAPAAAAARPRKRIAPDDPVIVDHRASSKLKRPWQDPQFNIKTIPAAARPATSSQLFSHSYPAPAWYVCRSSGQELREFSTNLEACGTSCWSSSNNTNKAPYNTRGSSSLQSWLELRVAV
jgi:hypothetical protein